MSVRAADLGALEQLLKDPEKAKALQSEVEKIMSNPEKRRTMEALQKQMQGSIEKLQNDPEMSQFFEDVRRNGMDAMRKYEKDEKVLKKFTEATAGIEQLAGVMGSGMPGVPPGGEVLAGPNVPPVWKPGDELVIQGLTAKPELNGKKAMVVPPTAEESETIKGTGRVVVRLLDSGEQFAVKPENLGTDLGDKRRGMPMSSPALQSEAAKLRESGKLEGLQNDPELRPIFEDIKENGMIALEKYWNDERLMEKISKVMSAGG